jgi:hypothetical protein
MNNDLFETNVNPEPSQLDRIEAKLDELLARKKKPVKAKSATEEYPGDFLDVWRIYPKRSGSNPKGKAFSAFNKRIDEGDSWHELFDGAEKYHRYCDATGKVGTEFVMQAATFFGPERHYENDWTIPKAATRKSLPRNDEDLEAFAVEQGLHERGNAPAGIDYRQYRQWIQERL